MQQVASAVTYIHAKDIVHGNIVPVCRSSTLVQWRYMNDPTSQANVMITDDRRACLTDVGINIGMSKVLLNSDAWAIPSGWMFKAPEELSFECEPASFIHTGAMDVYSLGITVYTVSLFAPGSQRVLCSLAVL